MFWSNHKHAFASLFPGAFLIIAATVVFPEAAVSATAPARQSPEVKEYPDTPPYTPCIVVRDPESNLVYAGELFGPAAGGNVGGFGVLNPRTGVVEHIPIPDFGGTPTGMAFGPDGALWFATFGGANMIGRLDPDTKVISQFPIPTPNSQSTTMVLGPDDGIWFAETVAQKIGRIDAFTHVFEEFPLPLPGLNAAFVLMNIGPGNQLIVSLAQTNQIATFDVVTHQYVLYDIPTPASLPQGVALGSDGAIWFTETSAHKLGRIDPITHIITEFSLSTTKVPLPFPGSMDTKRDGNLWILNGFLQAGDTVTRFDPRTHLSTTIQLSAAAGPCDNDVADKSTLWFGEFSSRRIGRINIPRH